MFIFHARGKEKKKNFSQPKLLQSSKNPSLWVTAVCAHFVMFLIVQVAPVPVPVPVPVAE